jgi:GTP-binding protein EngB required for normal cell division
LQLRETAQHRACGDLDVGTGALRAFACFVRPALRRAPGHRRGARSAARADAASDDRSERMKFETEIRALAELARALARDRAELADGTPFAAAMEETRHDLGRVASPVVAVVGPAKTGKSSLVNRLAGTDALPIGAVPTTALPVCLRSGEPGCLISSRDGARELPADRDSVRAAIRNPGEEADYLVWQLPELRATPWDWLDTPGWDALDRDRALDLDPWDLADVWVLTTSATHPMSAGDRTLLAQIAALARGDHVCVVVTRADQVDAGGLDEVRTFVERQVRDVWQEGTPAVLAVSSRTGDGVTELHDHLSGVVARLMAERLVYEVSAWRRLLDELDQIGSMKALAAVEARTVHTARDRLHRQLLGRMAALKTEVPRLAEETLRGLDDELPAAQRNIAPEFARRLERAVSAQIDAIGRELQDSLAAALGGDLPQKATVQLALERLTTLLDRRGPARFESRSAAMGASLGLSAGLSAALFAAIPMIGVPFAVASLAAGLAGGALGALFGGKGIIVDGEMLRDKVALPLIREVQSELDRVTAGARLEIDRLCNVMERAASLQSGGQGARGGAMLRAGVSKARGRADELLAQAEALAGRMPC